MRTMESNASALSNSSQSLSGLPIAASVAGVQSESKGNISSDLGLLSGQEARDCSYASTLNGQLKSFAVQFNDSRGQQQDDLIQAARPAQLYQCSNGTLAQPNYSETDYTNVHGSFITQHQTLVDGYAASNYNQSTIDTNYQQIHISSPASRYHSYHSANSDTQFSSANQFLGVNYSYQTSSEANRLSFYGSPSSANLYDQTYIQSEHLDNCYHDTNNSTYYDNNQTINNYQVSASTSYNVHHHHHSHNHNHNNDHNNNNNNHHHHHANYSKQQPHHQLQLQRPLHQNFDIQHQKEATPLSLYSSTYASLDEQEYQAVDSIQQHGSRQVKSCNHLNLGETSQLKQTISELVYKRQTPNNSIVSYHKNSNTQTCSNTGQNSRQEPVKESTEKIASTLISQRTGQQRINHCNICGRNYARPSTLKTHLRTHTNERPYKCKICGKTFSQAANLTAHQRVHTGERPFSCPICRRPFSQSSSVITHLRTHSGERPYRCDLCNRTFSDSSTLTKHCRIHSGEKPYRCEFCPLNFSQSGNLSRHIKLHLTGSLIKERVIDSGRLYSKTNKVDTRSISSSSSSSTSSVTSTSGVGSTRSIDA